MKKLVFLLVCVFTMQVAMADNDQAITFEQLPQTAQKFVKQYFPNEKIAFTKVEKEIFDKEYEVMFINGDHLEFNNKGEWKKLQCKHGSVPESAIPAKIKEYVNSNYPDVKVLSIEKDRYEYEVKLSNFWEITFDTKFNPIDMDRDD